MADCRRSAMGDTADERDLLTKYNDLLQRHESLREEHERTLIRLGAAQKKLVDQRQKVLTWQRWIDAHPKYVKPPSDRARVSPSPLGVVTEAQRTRPDDAELSRPSEFAAKARNIARCANTPSGAFPKKVIERSSEHPQSAKELSAVALDDEVEDNVVLSHPSSQTTEADSEDRTASNAAHTDEDADDVPVVVSARTLRHPRSSAKPTWNIENEVPGKSSRTAKIKREDTAQTQPLSAAPNLVTILHTQASDLDTVSRRVETPRKRRKLSHEPSPAISPAAGVVRGNEENTPPHTATSRHFMDLHRPERHQEFATFRNGKSAGPLTPLSTNAPVRKATVPDVEDGKLGRDERASSLSKRVLALEGDDEDVVPADRSNLKNSKRLADLLHCDDKISPKQALTPRARQHVFSDPETILRKKVPMTLVKNSTSSRSKKSSLKGSSHSAKATRVAGRLEGSRIVQKDLTPDPQAADEPLRARRPEALTLDDFRINPSFVGADFAYQAVLRGHENRRCVPGCTGPCCSVLRRFLAAERASPGRQANPSSPPKEPRRSPQPDDDDLLRAYLGHDQFGSMNPADRQSLLERARDEKIANRYGKHKQTYQRPPSPPGFWRTDWPNTQEQADDRAKAAELEREEVKRRWIEAMRGDAKGRYIFRDEWRR